MYIHHISQGYFANLPMVVDVIAETRPSTQENGREMKIALVPIFPTCRELNKLGYFEL